MSNFSVGIVEPTKGEQMKYFIQTGWRPYESTYRPNDGLTMLGIPQEFEATPEVLEKVLYRYQHVDMAACAELTDEIVRAYLTAREHNGHKANLTGTEAVIG